MPEIPLYTSGTVLAAALSPTDFGLVTDVILSQPKLDSDNRRFGIMITFETAKKKIAYKTANHVK